jgi:hypothetical protein
MSDQSHELYPCERPPFNQTLAALKNYRIVPLSFHPDEVSRLYDDIYFKMLCTVQDIMDEEMS